MPAFDDSLGGQTLGGDDNDDRFDKSLGDERTMGDANIEEDLLDDGIKLEDLSERYTEEGVLGKGGMGEVLLATDTRLDRKVAIKRILGKAARSKTASQRFLTEAKSIAALSHNNIVQIHDYGRSTEGPFLIMECVQGGSLLDKCKEGPIELEEAVNIFSQLCDGLAKAHAANIIHRDIKPANVLMTEDGVPKLTDFGLAKDDAADTEMTMEGAVIGTLDFMPPEQREGAHLTDHRSDLWSLAATFYQMLTGKSPKIIKFSDVPVKLQNFLGKALEDDKDDRYQSALEMREAILKAHSGKMDTSRTLGEGECPECGTLNSPDRKFCRECSAPLQVKCLACKEPMAIWDKGCGECGAQQQPLVDGKLEVLQRYHDQAEAHLQELEFEQANETASKAVGPDDPRLQTFVVWHEEFIERLEQSRTTEYARIKEILEEAVANEKAYDYQAGLKALEHVAPSLLNTVIDGVSVTEVTLPYLGDGIEAGDILEVFVSVGDTVAEGDDIVEVETDKASVPVPSTVAGTVASIAVEPGQTVNIGAILITVDGVAASQLKNRLEMKHSSLKQLEQVVRERVTKREFSGLLPIITDLLTLRPDHPVGKLKAQLEIREARVAAHEKAIACIAKQQYEEAVAVLNKVSSDVWDEQLEKLKAEASGLMTRVRTMRKEIADRIEENRLVDLLPMVKQCLELKENQSDLQEVEKTLVKGEANRKVLLSKAKDYLAGGDLEEAYRVFDRVHSGLRGKDFAEFISEWCEATYSQVEMLMEEGNAREALPFLRALERFSSTEYSASRIKLERILTLEDRLLATVIATKNKGVVDAAEKREILTGTAEYLSLISGTSYPVQPKIKRLHNRLNCLCRVVVRKTIGHQGVQSIAYSVDGRTLASGCSDSTIKLWDSQRGAEVDFHTAQRARVSSVACSTACAGERPDGNTIASTSYDNIIKLWDFQRGTEIKTFGGHQQYFSSIAFSPNAKTIAIGSQLKPIKLWDSQSGAEFDFPTAHSARVSSVAFSSDGKTIASGSYDRTIKLWDSQSGRELHSLTGHEDDIHSVAFSPDGKTLASGSKDHTIKLWDNQSGVELETLTGHRHGVLSVAFSPDGGTLASGSIDKTIKLWDNLIGIELKTLTEHNGWVSNVAFSPDGKTLASASHDKTIKLWDVSALIEP